MTLSAVLLAGGESRRMGIDKAQLIFEGEPLWQRQLRLLRQINAESIFVSAKREPAWLPADVKRLRDEAHSRGPISGISAALARTTTTHILVLAVDMPFIGLDDLLPLLDCTRPGLGVVPVATGLLQPLAAVYSREASSEFSLALSGTDSSVQLVVRRLAQQEMVRFVDVANEYANHFRSLNTPADLFIPTHRG
jgi:molybdenum cofactor guanylyltransferase